MEAFGFGDGAPEVVARGKRRTVTYLAFITFAMYVASISNTDWVSGGLEFVLTSANTPPALPPAAFEAEIAAVAGAGGCGGGACGAGGAPLDLAALPKRLGAGASQLFHFTTTSTVVSRSTTFTWSGQELVYSCSYDLPSYVNEINAAASSPNCTAGFQNPWCGAKAVPLAVFTTASGLLGTSSFAQALAWVTMAAAASDVPYVGNHKYTHEVALWGHLLAAFFGMVAWANFMASGLKAEFCTTLDPDERYNGLPCGYGDGFNAAIAATVVGLVNAAAIQFWAPRGAGGTRYEFSSAAGGAGAGLTKGASDAPAGAPGAYQDFGGAASSL